MAMITPDVYRTASPSYTFANDTSFIRHSLETLSSVVIALALGTLLLLISTHVTVYPLAQHLLLTIGFGTFGFMLGSVIIIYALKHIVQQMFLWHNKCLEAKSCNRTNSLPARTPSIHLSKALAASSSNAKNTLKRIATYKIWCCVSQIIVGIGALVVCILSCSVLSHWPREIISISAGILGGLAFSSGVISLFSYVISAQSIFHMYLTRYRERTREKSEKLFEAYEHHMESRIKCLEAKLASMRQAQKDMIINYETKLGDLKKQIQLSHDDTQYTSKFSLWRPWSLFWANEPNL